ncbi:MAG TPA: CpsD/CapB family tyrosine-protein kinase, partial [Oligoflexia bacterium]|nr:CpsD/CapB family tyrosine-protein kinase [Oligoflexia bacterium]
PFVTISAPRSFATESYRVIRTAILLSSADNPPKTLLVTSAKKGEGKTTFILNLAAALSQAGSKTLVVDADLRRPSVGRYFSIPSRTAGLADFLAGMKELDEVLRSTPIDRLFIIPAGSEVPNPAELIGSRKMAELLRQLAEQYDYVLVDTPPVLPATDAVSLSHAVDGVVLVVRGHVTVKHMAGRRPCGSSR